MVSSKQKVAFVGGGNMAEAIMKGLIDSGAPANTVTVSEPVAARRRTLARRFGVGVTDSNADAVSGADLIVLAVKPQIMSDVLGGLRGTLGKKQIVVSIAAGIPIARIAEGLGGKPRVVRVMPNTPCLLGKGASVLCGGGSATKADVRRAKTLFETVGLADVVEDEALLDAVTGLSGSGPAYVYLFAESLIRGGVKAGLSDELAKRLAFQTIAGAAAMMQETGQEPADLRAAVSSPGGTTLAGLARMKEGKLPQTVAAGVAAAVRRAKQLGKLA